MRKALTFPPARTFGDPMAEDGALRLLGRAAGLYEAVACHDDVDPDDVLAPAIATYQAAAELVGAHLAQGLRRVDPVRVGMTEANAEEALRCSAVAYAALLRGDDDEARECVGWALDALARLLAGDFSDQDVYLAYEGMLRCDGE